MRKHTMTDAAKTILLAAMCCTILVGPNQASWLSDFTGVIIDHSAGRAQIGRPDPVGAFQRWPQTIRNLPQDLTNLANPAGSA